MTEITGNYLMRNFKQLSRSSIYNVAKEKLDIGIMVDLETFENLDLAGLLNILLINSEQLYDSLLPELELIHVRSKAGCMYGAVEDVQDAIASVKNVRRMVAHVGYGTSRPIKSTLQAVRRCRDLSHFLSSNSSSSFSNLQPEDLMSSNVYRNTSLTFENLRKIS